jgi:hypothetical protein
MTDRHSTVGRKGSTNKHQGNKIQTSIICYINRNQSLNASVQKPENKIKIQVNALDPQHKKKQNKNTSESKTSTCIEHNKNKLIQFPTNNQNINNTLNSHHHTQSTKKINKV